MSADLSSVESPLSVLHTMPSNMTSFLHRVTHITAVHGYDGGLWYKHVNRFTAEGDGLNESDTSSCCVSLVLTEHWMWRL